MKPEDMLPGADGAPFDDEALSRCHRRIGDEELPAEVEIAVLAAARRLARSGAAPADDRAANDDDKDDDDGSDAALSRLHRDFSQEESPPEIDARILAAAQRLTQQSRSMPARVSPMQRLRVPLALAATLVMAVIVVQMVPRAPEHEPIELLGSQPDRDAEQRLAEIRRLIDQGRDMEASQRLEAFRKRHPNHRVPDDIRGQLDKSPARPGASN